MRKIKFRIWDGEKMIYDVMAGKFGVFYINPDNNGLDVNDSACLTPFNTIYPDSIQVMQFTGITDKNGVEIYEGDIGVRYLDEAMLYTDGKTWRDYWLIEWINSDACFTTTLIKRYNSISGEVKYTKNEKNSFSKRFNEIEIIGNIFENKEEHNCGIEKNCDKK